MRVHSVHRINAEQRQAVWFSLWFIL